MVNRSNVSLVWKHVKRDTVQADSRYGTHTHTHTRATVFIRGENNRHHNVEHPWNPCVEGDASVFVCFFNQTNLR